MKITLAAFTKQGGKLCLNLQQKLNTQGYDARGYSKYQLEGAQVLKDSLAEFTRKAFEVSDAIVFIGAAGIAVRAIAPFVTSKDCDPAVLVIDERGKYVIPILSGHIGGANELASIIAKVLNAQAVITTATDINGRFAVDSWAVNAGCQIMNINMIKKVSAAILNGEKVGLHSDFPVEGSLPDNVIMSDSTKVGICISDNSKQIFSETLQLMPKQYVLGIGCRRNTKYSELLNFVNFILDINGISPHAIEAIASIDLKSNENAICSLSADWKIPFHTYSANELAELPGDFSKSDFVKEITGVDNVCERAAVKANNGRLVVPKCSWDGITAALSKKDWRCRF
ncbi:Cobalamin synthesis G-like protein [Ruminiclostridium papyrosolvens DSM 2782]|uniref:Cobalamin synthesis G-like protein n=1 Tax=Ruminiclostridium papyrosolvens DSM 2782 TaxID=588581 RepID=F1T8W0_9FIRM|nr:cobalt-precorrin 5A hydrolase [Ruminiclostridium papyrosolvens]EGD48942.1 Cobalamin synthesis G-like protein [Ruminiclostridium papyrosolvens DSM 2782]WES35426.1 cobalt-precorrin 5A hydrolase [Ruminiclostridium papyrosolvens DSM 2782]